VFLLLPDAFQGIKQIGVVGWVSQVNTINFVLRICTIAFKFVVPY
jgi:hypothetical protein